MNVNKTNIKRNLNTAPVKLTPEIIDCFNEQFALGFTDLHLDYAKLPALLKDYFGSLILDIQDLAHSACVTLEDPYEVKCVVGKKLVETCCLPESVIEFYNATLASYEFIKDLVLLSINEDLAAFVLEDNLVDKGTTYTPFIVTNNYEHFESIMKEAMFSIEDNKYYLLCNEKDDETYLKILWSSMYDICDPFANKKGHEFYQRYIETTRIH